MTLALGGSAGFTIIEVMVVLAVTGFMFLIAVEATSGQISQASFSSGLSQLSSQIQNGAEQVEDGSYSDVPLSSCVPPSTSNPNGSVGPNVALPGGSVAQGTNSGCVFAGIMFQFVPTGSSGDYEQFSLAASRTCPNGEQLVLYCYGNSGPFDGTGIGPIDWTPSLTIQTPVPENMTVAAMGYTDTNSGAHKQLLTASTGNNVLFGFVQNFGLGLGQSGSQGPPYIVYVNPYETSSLSTPTAESYINGGQLSLASEACIGLSDGQQYAQIEIGSSGTDQLNVKIIHEQTEASLCS